MRGKITSKWGIPAYEKPSPVASIQIQIHSRAVPTILCCFPDPFVANTVTLHVLQSSLFSYPENASWVLDYLNFVGKSLS